MTTISKKGIVVDNKGGEVKVLVQRDSGCGSCSACGACENKPSFITAHSPLDLKPGDQVYLESSSNNISNLTSMVYIFPVIMTIAGALLANLLFASSKFDKDLITILFIVIFFSISILLIHLFDKRYEGRKLISLRKA
ncbi:MAG: SoxR reducing system RseC family protein [Peptoniphilaceae bacterium]|nr:SoxR reducing system RseC family protein [Peptoniphilaceae bacterium]MDY6019579.1 SoxR reducing system RseC family protein [Anaerococcus sp.]